jgi:cell fate (sporulation/competence/biofilm development) regulator YlbF (YheA/YmcA/DUF963 family)
MNWLRKFMPHRNHDAGWGENGGEGEVTFKTVGEAVAALKERGYIARNADEDKSFVSNASKKATEEAVANAIKENTTTLLSGIDSNIKDVLGVEKGHGVKTSDHVKTILTEYKTLQDAHQELKDKGISGEAATKELQKQFDTFKQQSKTREDELTGQIEQYKVGAFDTMHKAAITAGLQSIEPAL